MCEQILVTRDAVLIQPSGDPVSSGLLLLWLHHSYLPVILLCDTHSPDTRTGSKCTTRGSGFSVLELGGSILCLGMTRVCTHVSLTPVQQTCQQQEATVGQLAVACEECADMYIHTY